MLASLVNWEFESVQWRQRADGVVPCFRSPHSARTALPDLTAASPGLDPKAETTRFSASPSPHCHCTCWRSDDRRVAGTQFGRCLIILCDAMCVRTRSNVLALVPFWKLFAGQRPMLESERGDHSHRLSVARAPDSFQRKAPHRFFVFLTGRGSAFPFCYRQGAAYFVTGQRKPHSFNLACCIREKALLRVLVLCCML